jgi:hypothetical protein
MSENKINYLNDKKNSQLCGKLIIGICKIMNLFKNMVNGCKRLVNLVTEK